MEATNNNIIDFNPIKFKCNLGLDRECLLADDCPCERGHLFNGNKKINNVYASSDISCTNCKVGIIINDKCNCCGKKYSKKGGNTNMKKTGTVVITNVLKASEINDTTKKLETPKSKKEEVKK